VGTSFRHQENFVAAAFQPRTHPDFGFAAAILPAVIEESYAAVDGLMNDFDCSFLIGSFAKVVASETESRNFGVRAAKLSHGDGSAGSLGHGVSS
jgi:hypothetical protein